MARQARTSSHPLVPKIWSRKFYEFALEANYFGRAGLIGNDACACIRVNTDLKGAKKIGDTVRIPLLAPLEGVGLGNNGKMIDILEAYSSFYFDVTIAERGNATGLDGPMAEQLMIEDWPETAHKKLAEWKGVIMEKELIKALSGLYNLSSTVASVNEHAPSSSRHVLGGENNAGSLGTKTGLADGTKFSTTAVVTTDALLSAETNSNYLFGPSLLEALMFHYLDVEPRPKPLMIDGRPLFLCLIHPLQAKALIQNTKYTKRYREADVRGSKNVLMRDSLGVWNCGEHSVLIRSYGRIEKRTGASGTTPSEGFLLNTARTITSDPVANGKTVARALLMGAGSGAIGYGGKSGKVFNRRKGDEDGGSGRKPFFGVDWMYGVSKTVFKNAGGTAQPDYAVMTIDTCVLV